MTTECLSEFKLYFVWQHDTEHSIGIILYVEHFRSANHWLDHFRLIKLAVTSIGRRFRTHMICQNYKVSYRNFESTHLKLQPPWVFDLVWKGSSKKREVGNFLVGKSEMKLEKSISDFPTQNFPNFVFFSIVLSYYII